MIFETENSVYQLDVEHSRIRRLSGERTPTTRQGMDGEWSTYHAITDVSIGSLVIIVWEVEDGDEIVAKCSYTTTVRQIVETTH